MRWFRAPTAVLVVGFLQAAPGLADDFPATCPIVRDEATRAILAGPQSQWPKILETVSVEIQRTYLETRITLAEFDEVELRKLRPEFDKLQSLYPNFGGLGSILTALAVIDNDPALLRQADLIYKRADRLQGTQSTAAKRALAWSLSKQASAVTVPQARPFWDEANQILQKQAKRAGGYQALDDDWQSLTVATSFIQALRQRDVAATEAAIARQRSRLAKEHDPIKHREQAHELADYLIARADTFDDEKRLPSAVEASQLFDEVLTSLSPANAQSLALAKKMRAAEGDLGGNWDIRAGRDDCTDASHARAGRAWSALLLAGADETRIKAAQADLAAADAMLAHMPIYLQTPSYPYKIASSLLDTAERTSGAAKAALLDHSRRALDLADLRAAHCFCAESRADNAVQRARLVKASGSIVASP